MHNKFKEIQKNYIYITTTTKYHNTVFINKIINTIINGIRQKHERLDHGRKSNQLK